MFRSVYTLFVGRLSLVVHFFLCFVFSFYNRPRLSALTRTAFNRYPIIRPRLLALLRQPPMKEKKNLLGIEIIHNKSRQRERLSGRLCSEIFLFGWVVFQISVQRVIDRQGDKDNKYARVFVTKKMVVATRRRKKKETNKKME